MPCQHVIRRALDVASNPAMGCKSSFAISTAVRAGGVSSWIERRLFCYVCLDAPYLAILKEAAVIVDVEAKWPGIEGRLFLECL